VTVSQTINGTTTDLTNDLPNDPIQFVPPSVTATPPRYDLDGNLISDGRWTYTWDGENRLVKMVSIAWTQPSGGYLANATFPAITLEFAYDGLSRRVQKKTITSGTPTMEGYLYDGWNVLMISNLDPANGAHLARKWSCVWRPDVGSRLYARGSWQAAGGVGGLAWLQTGLAQTATMYTYQSVSGNAEVHIPMMDHMGNVRHYYQIKTTGPGASASYVSGQVSANLDYDAFGREVRATGTKTPASGQPPGLAPGDPWVDVLPFHFSTKFTDRESGLNYYGYRFYDAVDGRWLSTDPIGERGGPNLHAMVGNDAVNRNDVLGLSSGAQKAITVQDCEIVVYADHRQSANERPIRGAPGNRGCWAKGFIGCVPSSVNKSDNVLEDVPNHPHGMRPRQGVSVGNGGWFGRQQEANDAVESDQITEDAYNRLWKKSIPDKIKELRDCPCSCTSVTVRVIVGNKESLENLDLRGGTYRYSFPSGETSHNPNE
jgi:RHS repeat-associated protein